MALVGFDPKKGARFTRMVAFRKTPLCRAIGSPNFDWALDYGHRQEARKCWFLSQKAYFEPLIWPDEGLLCPIRPISQEFFPALSGSRKIPKTGFLLRARNSPPRRCLLLPIGGWASESFERLVLSHTSISFYLKVA